MFSSSYVRLVSDAISACNEKADEEMAILLRALALGIGGHMEDECFLEDQAFTVGR